MAQKDASESRANKSVLVRDNKYPLRRACRPGDMEALSTLKDEHSTISGELYQMDKQLAFLESSGPIRGARILRDLVETSGHFWEKLLLHMKKEEEGLFPVLEARLGKDRKLVELMRREHAELLASLESIRSELDRMTNDHDTKKTWTLASRLQELRGDLSDHLSREERVVFWLAELRLSRLDRKKIDFNIQSMIESAGKLRV
jgi:regulator of cell morphogenesis and NO signaling